jgi:GT2 family glycosyltransferase
MNISVIIPTYNRGPKLGATLDAVLACETTGLDTVEVIVVDDGSPISAEPVVSARSPSPPFTLRCIRQPNAGPAKARNTGFREARGEVVLFMDDDIIAPPGLLCQHIDAHKMRPGCVIFGSCPFASPSLITPAYRYVQKSEEYNPLPSAIGAFVPRTIVASGQLSVSTEMFDAIEGVYRDNLATPATEELELSYRLRELGIPVLHAPWIVALHDHAVTLDMLCRMQYKHAIGYAEVAIKCPKTLGLPEVSRVLVSNGPPNTGASLRVRLISAIKRFCTLAPCRGMLFGMTRVAEQLLPLQPVLNRLYTLTISVYFWKGIRDGLRKYGAINKPAKL